MTWKDSKIFKKGYRKGKLKEDVFLSEIWKMSVWHWHTSLHYLETLVAAEFSTQKSMKKNVFKYLVDGSSLDGDTKADLKIWCLKHACKMMLILQVLTQIGLASQTLTLLSDRTSKSSKHSHIRYLIWSSQYVCGINGTRYYLQLHHFVALKEGSWIYPIFPSQPPMSWTW